MVGKNTFWLLWTFLGAYLFVGCNHHSEELKVEVMSEEGSIQQLESEIILHSAKSFNDHKYLIIHTPTEGEEYILELQNSQTDEVIIHELKNGIIQNVKYTGDQVPFYSRSPQHRNILYTVTADSIFVDIINRGSYLIPITLFKKDKFLSYDWQRSGFLGGMLGVIILFLFIGIIAWVKSDRKKMLLYYLLYSTAALLYFVAEFGLADKWLWPYNPRQEETYLFIIVLCSVAFLLLLTYKVFQMAKGLSWIYLSQRILIGLTTAMMMGVILGIHRPDYFFPWVYNGILALVICSFLLTIIAGAEAISRNVPYAFYFLASLSIMIIGALIKPLALIGMIPYYPIMKYVGIAGLLFNMMALAALFLLMYFERMRYTLNLEGEILRLEKSALQAQMNPHFIFNSLNSIQNFISKNDRRNAMDYLAQFAKLIRRLLNASSEKKIPLSEEIQILEGYLSLEKLRFKDKFEFEIIVSPEINNHEITIPPMMIQPFVENAVIHGMKNKVSGGRIIVKFDLEPPYLKVVIDDNGQGIAKSSSPSHTSKGASITDRRLQLLNKVDHRMKILTQDKSELRKDESGTIVSFYILLENTKSHS